MEKLTPHHHLPAIQAIFADGKGIIAGSALKDGRDLNYFEDDIIDVVVSLSTRDFIKSSTPHNPVNSKVWHDQYEHYDAIGEVNLFIKFAGEGIPDIALVSFKEK